MFFEREHGDHCPRPLKGECEKFSTDGSRLGAEIAHTMGTMNEDEIMQQGYEKPVMTGMDAEQADWEMDSDDTTDSHYQ